MEHPQFIDVFPIYLNAREDFPLPCLISEGSDPGRAKVHHFFQAEVWHVHRDGTHDLKWQHPYQYWPKELRVSPDRLRRYEDSTG